MVLKSPKRLNRWFCYMMIGILINACVKTDDDLFMDRQSASNNQESAISFNRIDHIFEYVVEVCIGMDNFFPEQKNNSANHSESHKIYKLFIAPIQKLELTNQIVQPIVKDNCEFPRFVQLMGIEYHDFISPPPKV
jgi:hypothetical protein